MSDDELRRLVRIGHGACLGRRGNVFASLDVTKLDFDSRVLRSTSDARGECNVFLEGEARTVRHHGADTRRQGSVDQRVVRDVVELDAHRHRRLVRDCEQRGHEQSPRGARNDASATSRIAGTDCASAALTTPSAVVDVVAGERAGRGALLAASASSSPEAHEHGLTRRAPGRRASTSSRSSPTFPGTTR